MAAFHDAQYLDFDPFDGERDVDVRCRTKKLVTVRKQQACQGLDRESHGHAIQPGQRARYETALVNGEWGRYYLCLACMDKWLIESCGMTPPEAHAVRA